MRLQRRGVVKGRGRGAYSHLYRTKDWKDLRLSVLERDRYMCQQCGTALTGKAPGSDSPVVNHKTPHKGDRRLFHDPRNLEALCKLCHDGAVQASERRGYTVGCDEHGFPLGIEEWSD